MNVGLYNADGHKFPSLPLMKISAYHKLQGDNVELAVPIKHYDRVYVSRVFGDEYATFENLCFNADEVYYGGTGFAIKIVDGKEVYEKRLDCDLPPEIEHMYPDYSLYPEATKNTAYGFLTRGCPNNCGFCIVSKKRRACVKKGCRFGRILERAKVHKAVGCKFVSLQRQKRFIATINTKSCVS